MNIGLIDHIISFGRDYEFYRIYFSDGNSIEVTEKEFVKLDKKYNGELAIKVFN